MLNRNYVESLWSHKRKHTHLDFQLNCNYSRLLDLDLVYSKTAHELETNSINYSSFNSHIVFLPLGLTRIAKTNPGLCSHDCMKVYDMAKDKQRIKCLLLRKEPTQACSPLCKWKNTINWDPQDQSATRVFSSTLCSKQNGKWKYKSQHCIKVSPLFLQ